MNNVGHITRKEMLGNTEIIICRDYAAKTEEEKIAVLTDLKQLAYEISIKRTKDKQ